MVPSISCHCLATCKAHHTERASGDSCYIHHSYLRRYQHRPLNFKSESLLLIKILPEVLMHTEDDFPQRGKTAKAVRIVTSP